MNFTCCYECPIRHLNCHSDCKEHAKAQALNEQEKQARRQYMASRFDVSLNRVCEAKLRRAAK